VRRVGALLAVCAAAARESARRSIFAAPRRESVPVVRKNLEIRAILEIFTVRKNVFMFFAGLHVFGSFPLVLLLLCLILSVDSHLHNTSTASLRRETREAHWFTAICASHSIDFL
jgi:hypothetical protein